jgi:CheY-like chemotaxis protein
MNATRNATSDPDGSGGAGWSPTVLIVDDDPSIRETLRLILHDEGYSTQEAVDGIEAMDALLLTAERVIVLLDLMMPRMTGWDVLSLVTEHEQLVSRHAFIVMTANKYAAAAAAAADPYFASLLERHGVPILEKPFDVDHLLGFVAESAGRLRRPDEGQGDGGPDLKPVD